MLLGINYSSKNIYVNIMNLLRPTTEKQGLCHQEYKTRSSTKLVLLEPSCFKCPDANICAFAAISDLISYTI